jgi:transcriptional regulator with XRE-family HTH domain
MEDAKKKFAQRLREAMERAGYPARPAVLERQYNLRCWDKPMTLHGVRRWLRGETLPNQEKLLVLAEWLRVSPQELRYGTEIDQRVKDNRAELEVALRYQEREVFEAFLKLPQEHRRIVREVILAFSRTIVFD